MAAKFDPILGRLRESDDSSASNAHNLAYTGDTALEHEVDSVGTALDKLFNKVYYTALSILSFTGGGTYEVGTAISSVNFEWKLNKKPFSIIMKQDSSIIARDFSLNGLNFKYRYIPTSAIEHNTTFTLVCGDVTEEGVATTRTKTTTLSFLYKIFYNTITGSTPSTQSEIQAMGVGGDTAKIHWSNSKTITRAFKGKKFCIALPSSMKISKAVTSNNETITSKFVAGEEIDYTIGTTTTKYKVHTFEVAVEMDVTLTITLV